MSHVEFYKALSNGSLEPVNKSSSSLHYRRSILVKDDNTNTIWIFHGSGVSAKTKNHAEMHAKRINAEHGFQYKIKTPESEEADKIIQNILKPAPVKGIRKTISQKTVPKTPKVKPSKTGHLLPKGDLDISGPEIKEFQIAYYEEPEKESSKEPSIKDVIETIAKFVNKIDYIMENKPSKHKAKSMLSELADEILNLIYD